MELKKKLERTPLPLCPFWGSGKIPDNEFMGDEKKVEKSKFEAMKCQENLLGSTVIGTPKNNQELDKGKGKTSVVAPESISRAMPKTSYERGESSTLLGDKGKVTRHPLKAKLPRNILKKTRREQKVYPGLFQADLQNIAVIKGAEPGKSQANNHKISNKRQKKPGISPMDVFAFMSVWWSFSAVIIRLILPTNSGVSDVIRTVAAVVMAVFVFTCIAYIIVKLFLDFCDKFLEWRVAEDQGGKEDEGGIALAFDQ